MKIVIKIIVNTPLQNIWSTLAPICTAVSYDACELCSHSFNFLNYPVVRLAETKARLTCDILIVRHMVRFIEVS